MANTYIAIATVTVGSGGAANIEFTSIPGTYTDLVISVSGRTNNGFNQDWLLIQFNDVTTGYTSRILTGTGSVVSSNTIIGDRAATMVGATATSNTFSNAAIYIPNYAGSTNKSFSSDSVNEINATGTEAITNLIAGLWSNTAAITKIKLTPYSAGTIQQYSTATLYGIKKD